MRQQHIFLWHLACDYSCVAWLWFFREKWDRRTDISEPFLGEENNLKIASVLPCVSELQPLAQASGC